MKKSILSFIVLFIALLNNVMGQNRVLSGTVTDQTDGGPIPGVSILVKGTNNGTQTDANGKFSITISQGSILIFKSVGYSEKEVKVGTTNVINIALGQDAKELGEVVVAAMGVSREKKALGYNVQTLKSDDLTKAGNSSMVSAMQGKLSGVEIKPSSGMPGASAQVVIRGARSFTGSNAPLYVIDGMPVSSNADFSTGNSVTGADIANRSVDIDPNDIESMNVLKGQAAAALYGIRASNGVIVITTKSGKGISKGKPVVSFSSNVSTDRLSRKPSLQNIWAQGVAGAYSPNSSMSWGPRVEDLPNDLKYGGNKENSYTLAATESTQGKYYMPQMAQAGLNPWIVPQKYNNVDDFFEKGVTLNNSLNVSQATDKGNYSIGLGSSSQDGVIASTSMRRYTAKISAETNLNEFWKSGFSGNYAQSNINKASSANDALLGTVYPAPINYDLKGIPSHIPTDPYKQINYRSLTFNNPYWAMDNNIFNEKNNRFFGNGYVEFAPKVNWGVDSKFKVKYQLGVDAYSTHYQDIFEYGHRGGKGLMDNYGITSTNINSLLTTNYSVKLNSNFSLTALLGNEINQGNDKEYTEDGSDFNFGGWAHIDNATVKRSSESKLSKRTVGFFGDLGLAYKSLMFLNVTGRNDIVSNMPRGNRSFFYPSVSLGFVATELPELQNNQTITYLKLRASYAEVGQAGTYRNNYYAVPTYSGGFWSGSPIQYPYNGVTSYVPYSIMYDPNLKPQNTASKEVGFDLKLFNMLSIEYTFSRQNVTDQIFDVPMAGSSGISYLRKNGGKIHTNAHEIALNINAVKKKDADLNIGVNFTKMDNYVDELAPGVESIFLGGFVTPQVRAGIGAKYPVIYGGTFAKDAQGRILVDEDPKSKTYGMPMAGGPGVIGNVAPDFNLGGNASFRYKRTSLSATFDWKNGGQMYSGTNGLLNMYGMGKVTEDRSTPFIYPGYKSDGTPNDIKRGGSSDAIAYQTLYSDVLGNIDEAYIYDASFVKMRELTLSYKFPQYKHVDLSLSAFARNILLWSKLPNLDPESSQGNTNMGGAFERFSMPQTSSFGLGLNVTF